jgi:hypothetical protein
MKNIEDNIFSASKLVKAMRFKCNLRPDPLDGEDPTPDGWEGFFKIQGGVPYRIPIQYDGDQRMWYMHFGIGDTPSAAARDGILRARKQQVDLSDDKQIDYRHHAAKVCIVDRHTPHDMYQTAPYGSQYLPDTSAAPEIEGGPLWATQKTHTDTDATLKRIATYRRQMQSVRQRLALQLTLTPSPSQKSRCLHRWKLRAAPLNRRHLRAANPTPIYCPIPGHKIWAAARTAVCRRPGLSDV